LPKSKFPVMLTFDLDGESLPLAQDPSNASRPGILSQAAYGPKIGVHRILEMLDAEGVLATFFVPGIIVESYSRTVEAIHQAGHEIAHHGYTHHSPRVLNPQQEEEDLLRAGKAIEDITGYFPEGYRSPSWDFSDVTLELLHKHDFTYSSNLMDSDEPYVHEIEGEQSSLVELPVQWILDDAPFFLYRQPYHRPISPVSAVLETWQGEFDALYKEDNKCFVLTLHPQLSGRPSRVKMLRDFIRNIKKNYSRSEFGTCRDVASRFLP